MSVKLKVEKYLKLKATPLKATLEIIAPLPETFREEDIYELLSLKGIKFGILYGDIKKIFHQQSKNELIIAKANPPINGKDATIEEVLNIEPDSRPLLMENDKMDYKSIESYCTVNNGETIAIKHPLTKGSPGKSIHGEKLLPIPGKEVHFPAGENTIISEDKKRLLAYATGYLYRSKYTINVGTTLVIDGDVDLTTGHVKYDGDLVIKGNVQPGFKVAASGNILIFGDVENADIWSRSGSVEIRKGVFGKDNCYVFAKHNIRLEFAGHSKLTAEKKIIFNKYLINCKSFAHEGIYSTNPESYIFGGISSSYKHIKVNQLGNKSELKTRVEIHSQENDDLVENLSKYKTLEIKLNRHVVRVTTELKEANKKQVLEKNPDQKNKIYLKQLVLEYKETLLELKSIQKKIKNLEIDLNSQEKFSGKIEAVAVFPKVELKYGILSKIIEKRQNKAVFYFENNKIIG